MVNRLTDDHIAANRSALAHFEAFEGHRDRLTSLVVSAAPAAERGSLCVLGAGNAFDLDLPKLAAHYSEICLVDLDEHAVAAAIARQPPEVRALTRQVAPVDLSGLLDCADRWARFEVTPDELAAHATHTARQARDKVGASFDVVVSACMLSQMQLDVLRGFGDQHRLFPVVSWTLSVAHFRTLAELTKPGGTAVFATDLTEASIHPLAEDYARDAGLALVAEASRRRQVFDFADPGHVRSLIDDDPALLRAFPSWQLADAWVWQNGPTTRFLVYGAVLPRAVPPGETA